jgi:hypothetical protein
MENMFLKLAEKVGNLVEEKNKAYGNSFAKTEEFLKILYPEGIKPDQYKDLGLIFRIFDKMMRIASNKSAFGENPYQDIVGYGLLGMNEYDQRQDEKQDVEIEEQRVCSVIAQWIPLKHIEQWIKDIIYHELSIRKDESNQYLWYKNGNYNIKNKVYVKVLDESYHKFKETEILDNFQRWYSSEKYNIQVRIIETKKYHIHVVFVDLTS